MSRLPLPAIRLSKAVERSRDRTLTALIALRDIFNEYWTLGHKRLILTRIEPDLGQSGQRSEPRLSDIRGRVPSLPGQLLPLHRLLDCAMDSRATTLQECPSISRPTSCYRMRLRSPILP